MKKLLLFAGILFLFHSCKKEFKGAKVERAFYYWSAESDLNNDNQKRLNDLKTQKLYIKYFEVDFNKAMGNFPFSKTQLSNYSIQDIKDLTIVPTVFIKNEIFKFNSEKDLDVLADNMVFLIDKYSKEHFESEITNTEIQIDCDWTASTKDKYFYLLKKIKQKANRTLSCTLRLYPYKYDDKMGIPPVDKATLMCYNLIKPLSEKDKNSILDYEELKKYMNRSTAYPLHLDIALPIFFWSHLYQNNQFSGLLEMNTNQLQSFTKRVHPMWYEVTKDTVIHYDQYLRVGDKIKCEEVSKATIEKTIDLLKSKLAFDDTVTISLFHADDNALNQFTNEEITSFYDSFTK